MGRLRHRAQLVGLAAQLDLAAATTVGSLVGSRGDLIEKVGDQDADFVAAVV